MVSIQAPVPLGAVFVPEKQAPGERSSPQLDLRVRVFLALRFCWGRDSPTRALLNPKRFGVSLHWVRVAGYIACEFVHVIAQAPCHCCVC